MFGIGETEFVIILIFGFLLFGPDKLPGMGRTIGRVLRQFREASEGFTEVVQTNVIDPATQELNNTGSTKRTPAAAQKASQDDDDADIEDATADGAEEPRKRETFAERKARLEAEQAARETAAAAAAAPADGDDVDADVAADAPAADGASETVSVGDRPKEEPASPSVADLYARGSHRSSRAQADDAAKVTETASETDAPEPKADTSGDAAASVASSAEDGTQQGSAQDHVTEEGDESHV